MRKLTDILLISFLFMISGIQTNMISAQTYTAPEVEVSKEKVKIDGKIFLSHVVKEKQTLYSISKAYETSIEELYKHNPKLKEEGLKKNSILLIPVPAKKDKDDESAVKETEIKKQESAKDKSDEKPQRKRQDKKELENKKIHVVRWYEDIKSIAKKYGITVEDIMTANNLVDKRLTTRQKLIIPEKSSEESAKTSATTNAAEPAVTADSLKTADNDYNSRSSEKKKKRNFKSIFYFPKNNVNMAMFLPFQAQNGKSSKNNMDFYSGALLAIKHLNEDGINTSLKVYDTYAPEFAADYKMIDKCDLIVGPMTSEHIKKISEINRSNTPLISPLDPKTEILTGQYKNIIFAPSAHRRQYEDLCQWIGEEYIPENKVIVIAEKDVTSTNFDNLVSEGLHSKAIAHEIFKYNILEGRNITNSLLAKLSDKSTNRIVIASESEAFVNDVVRNINLLMLKNRDIVLYAASKIRSFETISPEYLHSAKLHVSTSYNIDFNSESVRKFLKEYRALYNTEPSQFAYQGYDVTKYFIQMYSQYGNWWLDCLGDATTPMLQSSFKFEKAGEGYVNTGVRRIVYGPDFQTNEIM